MAMAEEPMEPATIIRYPNRRLYDRSQGKYVTLQNIADRVRGGGTVTVLDSKTGEDLTRSILTQIILERHPDRMELFPVKLLHLIIRANEMGLGLLRDYVRQSQAYVDLLFGNSAANSVAAPGEWLRAFFPFESSSPAPPTASTDAEALARRVAELERRLDEVRRSNDQPTRKSRARRGKPKAGPH
jgi:polyhydroxyalkanoate synthesis repressor PhaR